MAEEIRKIFYSPAATSLSLFTFSSDVAVQAMTRYECRAQIVRALFALRAYYLPEGYELLSFEDQRFELRIAALKSAQIVANLIDYSDNSVVGNPFSEPTRPEDFWTYDYEKHVPEGSTFLTAEIINEMIREVATKGLSGDRENRPWGQVSKMLPEWFDFGLEEEDVVFGYERQPFISEVYTRWDGGAVSPNPNLIGFAIELINPYDTPIDITGWRLQIGSFIDEEFDPLADRSGENETIIPASGRLVIQVNSTGSAADANSYNITGIDWGLLQNEIETQEESIVLLKPAPDLSGTKVSDVEYLNVDAVSNTDLQKILGYSGPLGGPGNNALKRDDNDWGFVQAQYDIQRESDGDFTDTLGKDNDLAAAAIDGKGFQLAVPDDGQPLSRLHELEILGVYGNVPASSDPAAVLDLEDMITHKLANAALKHFDLERDSSDLLDYVSTIGRPDLGSLPGRININTAPVHVIAAAIPPTLADPNIPFTGPSGFSALDLADAIVANRPYEKLSDLLSVPQMKRFANQPDNTNAGEQSIEDDIEEEHWILSNLANKLTVRSDVFTAYILVRLGEEGPQRRMIGIFDRSQVWNKTDRPKLVALHPVPDPR
jgi:hypothetical protein